MPSFKITDEIKEAFYQKIDEEFSNRLEKLNVKDQVKERNRYINAVIRETLKKLFEKNRKSFDEVINYYAGSQIFDAIGKMKEEISFLGRDSNIIKRDDPSPKTDKITKLVSILLFLGHEHGFIKDYIKLNKTEKVASKTSAQDLKDYSLFESFLSLNKQKEFCVFYFDNKTTGQSQLIKVKLSFTTNYNAKLSNFNGYSFLNCSCALVKRNIIEITITETYYKLWIDISEPYNCKKGFVATFPEHGSILPKSALIVPYIDSVANKGSLDGDVVSYLLAIDTHHAINILNTQNGLNIKKEIDDAENEKIRLLNEKLSHENDLFYTSNYKPK